MSFAQLAVAWIAGLALIAAFFWWRSRQRESCETCYFPIERCECHGEIKCRHPEEIRSKVVWSQDGWVARCHGCGDIVYLGDD